MKTQYMFEVVNKHYRFLVMKNDDYLIDVSSINRIDNDCRPLIVGHNTVSRAFCVMHDLYPIDPSKELVFSYVRKIRKEYFPSVVNAGKIVWVQPDTFYWPTK